MDGEQIRALTGRQRTLVEELSRKGFATAAVEAPSPALRDDVTATLQAAIADPDVAARLGRLTKAEQWSGFGEFGSVTAVSARTKATPGRQRPPARKSAALIAAERRKAEADAALAELQSDLATARLRVRDARRRLAEAEQAASAAEDAHAAGEAASQAAAAAVQAAGSARYVATDGASGS